MAPSRIPQCMEVSVELYASTALPAVKQPSVFIEVEVGWLPV